jgi:hypothetical protein
VIDDRERQGFASGIIGEKGQSPVPIHVTGHENDGPQWQNAHAIVLMASTLAIVNPVN